MQSYEKEDIERFVQHLCVNGSFYLCVVEANSSQCRLELRSKRGNKVVDSSCESTFEQALASLYGIVMERAYNELPVDLHNPVLRAMMTDGKVPLKDIFK